MPGLMQLIYLLSLFCSSSPSTLAVCMLRQLQTVEADEAGGESVFCSLLLFLLQCQLEAMASAEPGFLSAFGCC